MGKDKSEKKEKKDKKERKEKKEKRAEVDGVKKSKKDKKKDKKLIVPNEETLIKPLEAELERSASPETTALAVVDEDGDLDMEGTVTETAVGALVPFAYPLADEAKDVKKILRTVKKSTKAKTLRRGVKEVVKALRKTTTSGPTSSDISNPAAIVIIAADISPMDVISHIPVLCEDVNIPYIYVRSRAALGEASATKRPTSVVMIGKEQSNKKAKEGKENDLSEFKESYGDLVKLVGKASMSVKK